MNPEDVPAELVEKVLETRLPSGGLPPLNEPQVRTILAAVLPDIQAQALREVADVVKEHTGRLESADGADEVVSLIESVIRHRAARLSTTTEELTT